MSLIKSDDFSAANDGWELNWLTGWTKHATYNVTMYVLGASKKVAAYANHGCYYWGTLPASADQRIASDFEIGDYGTEAGKAVYVAGRIDSSSDTLYRAGRVDGYWKIEKVVNGTVTSIGTPVQNYVHNVTQRATLEIKTVGGNVELKLYRDAEVSPIVSGTDSSSPITANGYVGLQELSGSLLRLDNFYAETIEAGGNSAPTFPGPNIGNLSGTVGTALTSNNVASKFSDTDALTFSAVGSWPPGVTVSSAGIISGTPTTAGTYSSLKVRATDTAAQTVDSDTFSFTISAAAHLVTVASSQQVNTGSSAAVQQAGNGTITLPALKDWGTGNLKANETGVTIIINNATTGVLVALLTGQTANASGVLPTLTGLVSGTAYRVTTILADGSEGTWKYTAS